MNLNPSSIQIRVLIVDDEPEIGEFLNEFLIDQGYEVFYADNGTDALEFVRRARPHIILLDVKMAEMDGLEILKQITQYDSGAGVIMVTASKDENTGRQALKSGAVDYITKPIDFNYLKTSLKLKLSAMLS